MIARGNVRKLIVALGKIQDRAGSARNLYADDRSIGAFEKADNALKEAFDLCVESRSMYDPVDDEKSMEGQDDA